MKKTVYAAAAFVLLTGTTASFASTNDVDIAIQEAVAAIDKAKSVGGEWRDSRKLIDKAQKAAEAGDEKKALKIAHDAKLQGELGYEQALSQKDAKPAF